MWLSHDQRRVQKTVISVFQTAYLVLWMVYLDLHERFVGVGIFRWSYEICRHLDTPFPSSSSGFPDDSSQFTWTFSRYQDFQVTLMSPWYPVFYTAHLDLPECLAGIGIFVWSYEVRCHLIWISRWFIWIYPNVLQVSGFSCDLTRFIVTSIPVFQTAHLVFQMVYLNLPERFAGIGIFVRAFEVHLTLIPHFPDSSSGFTAGIRIYGKTCDKTR